MPYSAVGNDGGTTPALKHFFRCLETSGAYWTDSKGGVAWPFPDVAFDSALQTIEPIMANTEPPTALSAGTWEQIDTTKSFVMVVSGRVNIRDATATRCSLGDLNNLLGNAATAYGVGMSNGPFHAAMGTNATGTTGIRTEAVGTVTGATATGTLGPYTVAPTVSFTQASTGANNATGHVTLDGGGNINGIVIDSGGSGYSSSSMPVTYSGGTPLASTVGTTGTATTTVLPSLNSTYQGVDVTIYIKYQPGVSFYMGARNSVTGALISETGYVNSGLLTVPTFTPSAFMRVANLKFYGLAIFQPAGALPDDIDVACWMMGSMWKDGDRSIYPTLIGLI